MKKLISLIVFGLILLDGDVSSAMGSTRRTFDIWVSGSLEFQVQGVGNNPKPASFNDQHSISDVGDLQKVVSPGVYADIDIIYKPVNLESDKQKATAKGESLLETAFTNACVGLHDKTIKVTHGHMSAGFLGQEYTVGGKVYEAFYDDYIVSYLSYDGRTHYCP